MKELKELLKDYETDIKNWESDFGEGHLFLADREALIPFEDNKEVVKLDKMALQVIEQDNSQGNDRLFLEKLKGIILNNLAKNKDAA